MDTVYISTVAEVICFSVS